ncbi:hypothetical protein V8D89_001692 [Ganoderma adspersum]
MVLAVPSNPLPSVGSVPPLDNTLGAVLIGTFIGLALYGLIVHQSYRYFRLYADDSRWVRFLVLAILALETFHVILSMHICYHYLVTNYYHPYAVLSGVWSVSLLSVTSGVVVLPSQSFFARRVFLLGGLRYRILVVLALILFAAELGFFCAGTAQAFAFPWFSRFQHYTWLISAGTGTAFVGDTLLTVVLVNLLRKENTGSKRMERTLETIMLYAVNTGLLTGIVNLLFLLFSVMYPNNLIYAGFGIVATKLYANSLLAALNSRKSLQYIPSELPSAAASRTLLPSRREMIVLQEMQEPAVAVTSYPMYHF